MHGDDGQSGENVECYIQTAPGPTTTQLTRQELTRRIRPNKYPTKISSNRSYVNVYVHERTQPPKTGFYLMYASCLASLLIRKPVPSSQPGTPITDSRSQNQIIIPCPSPERSPVTVLPDASQQKPHPNACMFVPRSVPLHSALSLYVYRTKNAIMYLCSGRMNASPYPILSILACGAQRFMLAS